MVRHPLHPEYQLERNDSHYMGPTGYEDHDSYQPYEEHYEPHVNRYDHQPRGLDEYENVDTASQEIPYNVDPYGSSIPNQAYNHGYDGYQQQEVLMSRDLETSLAKSPDLRTRIKKIVKPHQVKVLSPSTSGGYSEGSHSYVASKVKKAPPPTLKKVVKNKRFKRVTRKKNGMIVSIKKIMVDDNGNPTGPEEIEYLNEELLSEADYPITNSTQAPNAKRIPVIKKLRTLSQETPQVIQLKTQESQGLASEFSSFNDQPQQLHNRRQQLPISHQSKNPNLNRMVGKSIENARLQYQNEDLERTVSSNSRRVITASNRGVQIQRRVLASGQSMNSSVVKVSDLPQDFDINHLGGQMPSFPEEVIFDDTLQEYKVRFSSPEIAYQFYQKIKLQVPKLFNISRLKRRRRRKSKS
ncbi:hypothetical protein Anas_11603 [Armadillidium nasatum]|uniref:Uncharacterized protein n=1 Tax=Armadillidium nasatum TaxID=96803 RepID=A0A5N5SPE1_9CRUS|nr:hypothetical protein Anas_11603 [Armadillidium nasatum]